MSTASPQLVIQNKPDGPPNMPRKSRARAKPLVSLVVSAYNEAGIIQQNLETLCKYMTALEHSYLWELIVVNDGSTDDTGILAEHFAKGKNNVHVLHHIINFQLGQALQYAFHNCSGDYVVTMDVDLSYAPDHIERLLTKILETRAKIVLASPYMKNGRVSNVPWLRKELSRWANRFLSLAAHGSLSTITGMVRAYDVRFLRSLSLRAMDMEINSEIIFKAQLLGARIEEIPAHLDWSSHTAGTPRRTSSMKIVQSTMSYLVSGFIFRPFMFFLFPGIAAMLVSLYVIVWIFIHVYQHYQRILPQPGLLDDRFSAAIAAAFEQAPHTFFIGGISLMFALQLISLGILALQNKKYFHELFHLGTAIYKSILRDKKD